MLDELESDLERAQALQNLLIAVATGDSSSSSDYPLLRAHFINDSEFKKLLPAFVRTNRDAGQFWQFIKEKFPSYAERRKYIWEEFSPLVDQLEGKSNVPLDSPTDAVLRKFDDDGVHAAWRKALLRRTKDPEGAITAARSLLETVCKHILEARGIPHNDQRIELPELYKLTAIELNLSPSQHTQDVFKQILGGCSAIVGGLGTLRNKLGDAHGQGKQPARPASRHAELAVNLAGSMSLFLVSTWLAQDDS